MGLIHLIKSFALTIRESANDGSDFSNPDADYRVLFLGEDGQLHVKDSAGTVTDIGTGSVASLDDVGDVNAPTPSDGDILTWDSTPGEWVAAPNGGAADILDLPTAETDTSLVLAPDGAGGVEFRAEAGGSGGTRVLLWSGTASSSATLNAYQRNAAGQSGDLIQSDHKLYELVFQGVAPATNSVEFIARVGTGGGGSPTIDSTSGHYSWIEYRSVAGAAAAGGSGAADGIRLVASPDNLSNDAAIPLHATARLYNPTPGTVYPAIYLSGGHKTGGGSQERRDVDGLFIQTTSITALQFLMSSGNIASGEILIYALD